MAVPLGRNEPSKEDLERMERDIFERNILPKDAIGIPENVMEGIYAHAYRLYNSGRYRESAQLFRLLVMLNAIEPKYVMGLAACHHLMGQFDNALMTYAIVASLDDKDPMPNYHSADCYLQLGMKESGLEQMQAALTKCGDDPVHEALKNRIIVTIGALVKQIADSRQKSEAGEKETQPKAKAESKQK